jgi:hypothetical protein
MSSAATSTAPSCRNQRHPGELQGPRYATAIGLIRYAQILETERAEPPGVLRQDRPLVLAFRPMIKTAPKSSTNPTFTISNPPFPTMIPYSRDPHQVIPSSSVKIIGLGGAGANMLERIALDGMEGAELLALNTDIRTLGSCLARRKSSSG